MHKHNCGCEHDLKYCGHCDVVYCSKCGKEWKQYFYYYSYYPYTTTIGTGIMPLTNTVDSTSLMACSHHKTGG